METHSTAILLSAPSDSFSDIKTWIAKWRSNDFVDAPLPHTDDSPSGGNLSVNKAAAADTFAL